MIINKRKSLESFKVCSIVVKILFSPYTMWALWAFQSCQVNAMSLPPGKMKPFSSLVKNYTNTFCVKMTRLNHLHELEKWSRKQKFRILLCLYHSCECFFYVVYVLWRFSCLLCWEMRASFCCWNDTNKRHKNIGTLITNKTESFVPTWVMSNTHVNVKKISFLPFDLIWYKNIR